ncbi:phage tail protein [Sphingomonas sp. GB1N7]|uniref:phage tail protein n=1 Tax=Parasphingomonas caseinilytica TaxID=3096158 RepID=UPI002FC8614F
MATLVLTVVGGVIGGPVGAAIGSLIGQKIDRDVLFKPNDREGPRLQELALQTSSYGTPIGHVFGTMRIGGCVIWATDLRESRSTSSGGKGQPSVASYSYSASFAVALSGRPIVGVGRIWADGKLLRGAAGDFKSATGFRLHLGGEDQAVDPLIAAAEGALAPAHRGVAYAVFEDLQLADYGNRIPSLTFEVIGDEGAVSIGGIVREVSGGLVVADDGASVLAGFAAYGDTRSVLEMLAAAGGAWFAPEGSRLRMSSGLTSVAELRDDGFGVGDARGTIADRTVAAIETVPLGVTVAHYDPARDYQTGVQRARRPGPGRREERIELPAAVSADLAKTLAEALIARGEAGRERRTLALGWGDLAVPPGACVTIRGAPGVYRVASWAFENMVVKLGCVRLAAASAPASASAGRMLPAPDAVAGTTILQAFEIPPLDDAVLSAPRLTIAAAGTAPGWRRAALLYSLDDGAVWTAAGSSVGVATLGTLASVPGAGPSSIVDRIASFEIDLAHADMALVGADARALEAGANIALVGDELLQFGVAMQIGARRWRLSELWRGRRGTEAAIGTQAIGGRFVLIEPDAVATIDLPLSAIGGTVRVLASGIGDVSGPVESGAALRGVSVLPPSPAHLRAEVLPGGDVLLRWVRRSRSGWRWIDGVEAPLAEEREAYRVTIAAAGIVRTIETDVAEIVVPAADVGGGATVAVRQVGANGESLPVEILLPIA